WDIRHNFTTGFTWDVPVGRGKKVGSNMNPAMNYIIGGWQINGLATLHTGPPFTLRSNGCQGVWNACRPDLVVGKNPANAPSAGRGPDLWFDTSAVAPPAPLTGGNLGLQTNTAPPTKTLDMSFFKDFPIKERTRIQFRAETFNLFNTPQFSVPDNNRQNANFGKVTSTAAGSERHIQFALRLQF